MSTRLPSTSMSPWLTNWRAWGRVEAQPARYTTLSRRCSSRRSRFSPVTPGEAGGLLVGPAELALEDAVDVLGLLLLLQLDQVLAAARATAGAAVGARRVGPALEGLAALVVLEDVGAEAPRELHLGPGVARHVRPSAASAGGIRCGAPG